MQSGGQRFDPAILHQRLFGEGVNLLREAWQMQSPVTVVRLETVQYTAAAFIGIVAAAICSCSSVGRATGS